MPLGANAVSVVDYKKFIGEREASNPLKKLPKQYRYLAYAFLKDESKKLLLYRLEVDYKIKL